MAATTLVPATDPAAAGTGAPAEPAWPGWLLTAGWVAALAALAWLLWPVPLGGLATVTIVSGSSMEPTYHTGDLALVRRTGDIAAGDVIVYRVPAGEPGEGRHVIHRVIGGDAAGGWVTRGENRDTPDIWRPRPTDVLGTVRGTIPQGGTLALQALSPLGLGLGIAVLFLWALWPSAPDAAGTTGDREDKGSAAPANR
jgi:signal peptidase I